MFEKVRGKLYYNWKKFTFNYLDDCIDILKYINTDFSTVGSERAIAADGAEYNVHDAKFWDIQWEHWGESEKRNKNYYIDIPQLCHGKGFKNILEVGCGPGYLIENFINTRINKYTAFDISEKSVSTAKNKVVNDSRFDIFTGNLREIDIRKDDIDCVLGVDILEHLPDDLLLNIISQLNNMDLKFVFVTPYLNYVPTPVHIQCFSKRKLKKLLFNHKLYFKEYCNYREIMVKNF